MGLFKGLMSIPIGLDMGPEGHMGPFPRGDPIGDTQFMDE